MKEQEKSEIEFRRSQNVILVCVILNFVLAVVLLFWMGRHAAPLFVMLGGSIISSTAMYFGRRTKHDNKLKQDLTE